MIMFSSMIVGKIPNTLFNTALTIREDLPPEYIEEGIRMDLVIDIDLLRAFNDGM